MLGPGGHNHEQERGSPCSQGAHSPGEMDRPLKNFVIISGTEDCGASRRGLTPDLGGQRRLPEDGASKRSCRRDHRSAWRGCVCACAFVRVSVRIHASAWVTRVWQHTGAALQAEGVVRAKVGGERKHLLCWFYNSETFSVVEILRKLMGATEKPGCCRPCQAWQGAEVEQKPRHSHEM